ncbi:hypothetical protein JKA73_18590 [Myxococcus xanthus]|uniref:hypothetical protein n=1 Tax=Myxococcus xanthus TaxID=34 RepID=UPI001916D7E0|nr:hypothetical protein [Myxococcus xanthus]QQR47925.1 hypothetical protein JKA73_18590 [Myxococcus xanthus]
MVFKSETVPDQNCERSQISISDEDALAQAVAYVLIQRYSHAKKIALNTPDPIPPLNNSDVEAIIKKRLRATQFHRDGLLFQIITWLWSTTTSTPDEYVDPPHTQQASHGQDSIILHLTSDGVSSITVCEDKATENPRDTIRDEVWPEIEKYEAKTRDDELRSKVVMALSRQHSWEVAEEAASSIFWDKVKQYRVRITTPPPYDTGRPASKLFDGFASVAPGAISRRQANTVFMADLRGWMDTFAIKVEEKLRATQEKTANVR